jgi:hypothetical protein
MSAYRLFLIFEYIYLINNKTSYCFKKVAMVTVDNNITIDFHNKSTKELPTDTFAIIVNKIKTTMELNNCSINALKKWIAPPPKEVLYKMKYDVTKLKIKVNTHAHAIVSMLPPQMAAIRKPETVINELRIPL